MGDYLSFPNKEKHTEVANDIRVSIFFSLTLKIDYAATGMQGWRKTMEDSHIAELDLGNGVSVFGVFDGHGGIEFH